jgi:hypothetical protein
MFLSLMKCCNNSDMHEYSVALRLSGANLDPTEVTARLGLTPTQVRIAGQRRPGGKSEWDESMWEYEVRPDGKTYWSSLEEGLMALIPAFRSSNQILEHYRRNVHVFLWCGHFFSSFGGGPTLSSALLKQLGEFGVELYLDTFFSEPTDSHAADLPDLL